MILTVKIVFTLATLAYLAGLRVRHSNNTLHRKLMALGFLLTLGIAVILVVGVHGFGSTYAPAPWLVSLTGSEHRAHIVLLVHRGFATLTLVLLITQIVSGIRRRPLHGRLAPWTVCCWMVSFVSGLFVFV